MDTLWLYILEIIEHIRMGLDFAFQPLEALGPTAAVTGMALATMLVAKTLTENFKTKRYKRLQSEFDYWYRLRQEAMRYKGDDPDKAKGLAKDLDKGKLNELYYNYFIEGLLNNLLTLYIPVFSMLTYVNNTYDPAGLRERFGSEYLFSVTLGGRTYEMGAIFWFLLILVASYILWVVLRKRFFPSRNTNHGIERDADVPAQAGQSQ
ncbi:MAG: hypothetical protein K9K39_01775 [Desulfohalobiaceae bacterium]|nr:hypothetical protein [Desulfohalobiaceae bacterium]